MIILDTNVVSELMRGDDADPRVLAWARTRQAEASTTVINRAEILAGIELLAAGRGRSRLRSSADAAFALFEVALPFDGACADRYASMVASRQRSGRPIDSMDALVAAIACEAGPPWRPGTTADFEGLGLELVDPWA